MYIYVLCVFMYVYNYMYECTYAFNYLCVHVFKYMSYLLMYARVCIRMHVCMCNS